MTDGPFFFFFWSFLSISVFVLLENYFDGFFVPVCGT